MSLRFDRIAWPLSESYKDLIADLQATIHAQEQRALTKARNESPLLLVVDASFIHNLTRLSHDAMMDLRTILLRTRITSIQLNVSEKSTQSHTTNASMFRDNQSKVLSLQRFQSLTDTLGWIPTLTQASVRLGQDGYMFASLQQFIHLKTINIIIDASATKETAQTLLSAVTKLVSLSTMELHGETRLYPVLLPALLQLSSLTKLSLTSKSHGRLQATFPFHMNSLASFLNKTRAASFKLSHLDFAASMTHDLLCQALCSTNMTSLEICACQFYNVPQVAAALSKSSLRRLVWSQLIMKQEDEPVQFLSTLGSCLPDMTHLEYLEINLNVRTKHNQRLLVAEEAIKVLFQGAARCSTLKMLKIVECPSSMECMDKLLANCVRASTSLQSIDVCFHIPTRHIDDASAQTALFTFPAVCEAIQTNYALQNLRLTSQAPSQLLESSKTAIDTRTLDALLRLNKCGRKYMATDAGNRRLGISVLAQTTNSLDCLYIHLRENPVLCQLPLRWKKRKAARNVAPMPNANEMQMTRFSQRSTRGISQRSTRGTRQSVRFCDL
jgi:hypothetical protein